MKTSRINIGTIRRGQIVDAAVAVIAEQGLQNLSLSEIEKKVGMSRGQLTYYFKAKEDILVAVFDRLVQMMCDRHEKAPLDGGPPVEERNWLDVVAMVLRVVMQQPPAIPEFHALQHTFLAQISHREDFRRRLAELYCYWRGRLVEHYRRDVGAMPAGRSINPAALALVVQAMFHGLAMQTAADPAGFDAEEVVELCLDMLGTYVWQKKSSSAKKLRSTTKKPVNGSARAGAPVWANEASHERK